MEPGKPAWQGNAGLNYRHAMGDGLQFKYGLNAYFRSTVQTNQPELPELKGYVLADTTIGLTRNGWDIDLYVQNLAGKQVFNSYTNVESRPIIYVNRPRTLGVQLTYRY